MLANPKGHFIVALTLISAIAAVVIIVAVFPIFNTINIAGAIDYLESRGYFVWAASTIEGTDLSPDTRAVKEATFVVCASDALNTTQCDYVADGVADDVQIQAAIDAIPTLGGKVVLTEGTFIIENEVTLVENLILEGTGNYATLLAGYTSGNMLKYLGTPGTDTGRVTIRNLAISGYGNKNAPIYIRGGLNHTLENLNVRATNVGGYYPDDEPHGIHLVGVLSSKITNVDLGWNTGDGLHLERYEGDIPVPNNAITIESVRSHVNGGNGIYVGRSSTGVRIIGSTVEGNSGYGIHLYVNYTTQILASYFETNALGDIYVESGNSVNISGSYFGGTTTTHIKAANSTDHLFIQNNWLNGPATPVVADGGSTVVARDNRGYVTENSGTATITSGSTSVVITHGLDITPSGADCSAGGLENPTNSTGTMWLDTFTPTQFTINVENDPGASNFDIAWHCEIR